MFIRPAALLTFFLKAAKSVKLAEACARRYDRKGMSVNLISSVTNKWGARGWWPYKVGV